MHINISCKNITLDNPLGVFIEQKIGGLARYFKDDKVQAHVEIGKPSKHHRKGPVFYAEVNLKFGSKVLRGEATHEDLRTAITEAKDELQIQIKKLKEKNTQRRRRD